MWFSGSGMSIGGDNEIIHVPDTDETEIFAAPEDDPEIRLLFEDKNPMHLEGSVLYVDKQKDESILAQHTVTMQTRVYHNSVCLHYPSVCRALCLETAPNDNGLVDEQEKIPRFKRFDIEKHGRLRFLMSRDIQSQDVVLIPVHERNTDFFVYLLYDAKTELQDWIRKQESQEFIIVQTSRRSTLEKLCEKLKPYFPSPKSLSIQLTNKETLYMTKVSSKHPAVAVL